MVNSWLVAFPEPRQIECESGIRAALPEFVFSFAPPGLGFMLWLSTHGLRPFGKLRAGCGLHSFAASRLSSLAF
jgi:hypothetical protein